mmetsp:Transcript_91247/g.254845  ORF Transcript_91247/g.254845 Transcript_91247/m.254845 type:complete len:225 (+) Transcript_91247:78-752(+)
MSLRTGQAWRPRWRWARKQSTPRPHEKHAAEACSRAESGHAAGDGAALGGAHVRLAGVKPLTAWREVDALHRFQGAGGTRARGHQLGRRWGPCRRRLASGTWRRQASSQSSPGMPMRRLANVAASWRSKVLSPSASASAKCWRTPSMRDFGRSSFSSASAASTAAASPSAAAAVSASALALARCSSSSAMALESSASSIFPSSLASRSLNMMLANERSAKTPLR